MDGRKGRGELCRVWEEFCGLSLPSLPNSLAGSDRALALPQNKHLPVSTLYSTKLYCFISALSIPRYFYPLQIQAHADSGAIRGRISRVASGSAGQLSQILVTAVRFRRGLSVYNFTYFLSGCQSLWRWRILYLLQQCCLYN